MLINSLYVIVSVTVLHVGVSFLCGRVLVWEIWDPKFSERTSPAYGFSVLSLSLTVYYCRKVSSCLQKRLLIKPGVSIGNHLGASEHHFVVHPNP